MSEMCDAIGDGERTGMTTSAALDVEAVARDHLQQSSVLHVASFGQVAVQKVKEIFWLGDFIPTER